MDFSFSEEQEEVRNLARKILEDLATHERLNEIEASADGIDRQLWKELAKANLLGLGLPAEFGGSELGYLTVCVLLEEIGRTVAPVPALATLVLGALPIAEFGSAAQRSRLLPGVVNGDLILTAALQEAGSDDPARPATTARRQGSGWHLDGVKICVPAAHVAERILVPARSDDAAVGVFLVDPRADGVELAPQKTTNREPHFQLTLSGVAVAGDDVLGDPLRGAERVQWLTERATAAYCAVQLGVSEKALRMTAEYTSTREQFKRPVGSFQAVHTRAGDAYIQVEGMRLTTQRAVWRLDQGLPAEDDVAVAKFWAAEGGQFVGYAAQHLHGGIGVDIDYPLHRYYLWSKQIELTLGSASVQLARIGARMAREPVEYEG
ncbi:MAG: acyl-CoA dehydrogenase family protein [Myxococcota bacterium]